ncbi:MAG: hypothetical protein JO002_08830, partial [Burkholderiaceae bacterium]|nr:hypothetical protein [Burkholderiaceae bacterium]
MTLTRKRIALFGLAIGLTAASLPCQAGSKDQDDDHTYTVGISFDSAEGKYGSPYKYRTDTTDLSFSKDIGQVTLAANLPYVAQNGPIGSIIVAGHPVIVDGA